MLFIVQVENLTGFKANSFSLYLIIFLKYQEACLFRLMPNFLIFDSSVLGLI